ncbi:MAG TPA: STM4013/SEN3800 family hydrolase [Actinospica sp.]|nr:STM4013/SEN3800 family hydrolase [Actinospica sp.]
MNEIVGSHDLLFVTIDTLRHDVAVELLEAGRLPNLARALPRDADGRPRWEERHTPGSFTFAAHSAFFAGFLPTPIAPGPHPRLFAARFSGSESTAGDTWVFDEPSWVEGLAKAGYHTACIGGVGFFNPESALGTVLPSLFTESHWSPATSVADPHSFETQIEVARDLIGRLDPGRRLLLFVNVPALHQPNWFYLDGAERDDSSPTKGDTRASHAAALEYVDRHIGTLFDLLSARGKCFAIVCSDHGTLYGEDGLTGHRVAHPAVWTVPYAEFVL